MSLEVEIVVAGGVGDLLASMLGGLSVERRPAGTLLVTSEAYVLPVLDRLGAAGSEVLSIVEVPDAVSAGGEDVSHG